MSELCPLCDGTGWRPVELDGVHRVQRCDCWFAAARGELVRQANIPRRYEHCTLASFVAYNLPTQTALEWARRFVADFPLVDQGALLLGGFGVGKTHLAVAILNEVLHVKSIGGLFYEFSELLKLIRSTYDPVSQFSEMEVLRPVLTTPLLVLDDVGAEVPSAWVRETFEHIINSRYSGRRATILTSNFADEAKEGDARETFRERVGPRMRSRLEEMCTKLVIDGIDVRPLVASGIALSRHALEHEWRGKTRPRTASPAAAKEGYFEKYPGAVRRPPR